MTRITASTLYNLVQCPKRVERDWFGDPRERDPISPFIAMLWERGTLYEQSVIASGELEFLDLSGAHEDDQERLTIEAMQRGEPLIYSGRIVAGDLVGIPDLLRRHGTRYLPVDIISGRGEGNGPTRGSYSGQISSAETTSPMLMPGGSFSANGGESVFPSNAILEYSVELVRLLLGDRLERCKLHFGPAFRQFDDQLL